VEPERAVGEHPRAGVLTLVAQVLASGGAIPALAAGRDERTDDMVAQRNPGDVRAGTRSDRSCTSAPGGRSKGWPPRPRASELAWGTFLASGGLGAAEGYEARSRGRGTSDIGRFGRRPLLCFLRPAERVRLILVRAQGGDGAFLVARPSPFDVVARRTGILLTDERGGGSLRASGPPPEHPSPRRSYVSGPVRVPFPRLPRRDSRVRLPS